MGRGQVIEFVLDSSAILAALNDEPGGDDVGALLPRSLLLSVNLAEVVTKLIEVGATPDEAATITAVLECEVVPFDRALAFDAGVLRRRTRHRGLSLGDRACLALGRARGLPVYTAERGWRDLDVHVDIRLIR